MELTTFSVLDIVLITGLLLLLFRAYKNGALNELVYLSVASLYVYVVLNNLNAVLASLMRMGLNLQDHYIMYLF